MAMSFAVVGLFINGIKICDPDCVSKSYPNFWKDFSKISRGIN
jgi:3-phosphoshikimate 1-carboxyvinyltransferase